MSGNEFAAITGAIVIGMQISFYLFRRDLEIMIKQANKKALREFKEELYE